MEYEDLDNQPSLVVMCANEEVLHVNMSTGDLVIDNDMLLPLGMKNRFKFYEKKSSYTDKDLKYIKAYARNNSEVITNWLANRTLLLSRKNAKKLYQAYRLEQLNDENSRAKLSIACRALSVLDNYWVKLSNDNKTTWDRINIRHNSLNEAIAQIALHGTSLSLQGSLVSPEFTTNGVYAKAWHRDDDGSLWLYKLNDAQSTAKVEVMVSNLLDHMNVTHCHYEAREDMGEYVCACPLMTNDSLSIADGLTFNGYCNRLGLDTDDELIRMCHDDFYKMLVVDYLIANIDRHGQNWGIYYKADTTEVIGLHPLFDHNNAFDVGAMDNEEYESHFFNKSLKENALMAVKKTDIHFTKPVARDIFLTTKQYETFMHRAEQLGIKTITGKGSMLDAAGMK
jgi:hypothetical protein